MVALLSTLYLESVLKSCPNGPGVLWREIDKTRSSSQIQGISSPEISEADIESEIVVDLKVADQVHFKTNVFVIPQEC